MRLLIVAPGASWSTADVDDGLRYGLEHHGVQVIQYRLDGRIAHAAKWLHGAWRREKKADPELVKPNVADVMYQAGIGALEMALRHRVDAVLVVSAMYFHPDVIVLMKRAGLTVTVLFTESPYDLAKELEVARLVDGCWTNERSAVPAFRAVNSRGAYLPHAWHPLRHRPSPQAGDELVHAHDVVFVGSAFRERVDWFSAIDWTGIDLGLYGNWDVLGSRHPLRQFLRGKTVPNAMTAALYRRAKISLNLYRRSVGFGKDAPFILHAESLNPRAYELAACGAFHLSDPRAEVTTMFGDAVPTFAPHVDAGGLIRSWLADEAGRLQRAALLPDLVAADSWTERAAVVMTDLETLRSKAA